MNKNNNTGYVVWIQLESVDIGICGIDLESVDIAAYSTDMDGENVQI